MPRMPVRTLISRTVASAAALALSVIASQPAAAQDAAIRRTFVHLANGVPAVLYEPANPGPKAQIAVFAMHSGADYLEFSACSELSQRGYRVLCANNSLSKAGGAEEGLLDKTLGEAGLAVKYLRGVPGVGRIVLLGHSGGATLMSAYQMIAEGGVKTCQGPEKIYKCDSALAGLPPADGFMSIDSNWGMATMSLFSLDPAVIDETTGRRLDPALDLFSASNGFDPKGASYSAGFIRRFQAAQGARNNRLIDGAEARLAAVKAGTGRFSDDEPMVVPGANLLGFNNKLFAQDLHLMAHTQKPWPLIRADGSITTQVIPSVRPPMNAESFTPSLRGALKTTVRGYLNSFAVRTTPDFAYGEDGVRGIDWESTYAVTPGNVGHITVPTLVMGMTGGWEYLAAETIYERSAAKDKAIAFVEGATHVYTPCKACERRPGQFGDTIKLIYDHVDQWLWAPGRFH